MIIYNWFTDRLKIPLGLRRNDQDDFIPPNQYNLSVNDIQAVLSDFRLCNLRSFFIKIFYIIKA